VTIVMEQIRETDEIARHGKERNIMKKTVIVASAVLMLMGFGMAGAQEAQPADKVAEGQTVKKQTVCPVMGGQVNTNIYVDANGKRVYFCCNDCPAAFKKDPAKYIAKLEKDGVTLDKAPAAAPTKKQTAGTEAAPAQGHDHSAMKEGGGCCK
jgi:YHS domain-containing protein